MCIRDRFTEIYKSLLPGVNDILKQLEEKHVDEKIGTQIKNIAAPKMQLSIFDAHSETFDEIRSLLENMDINRLTPVEALIKLNEIQGLLK